MRRALPLPLALVLLALAPPLAGAAEVRVEERCDPGYKGSGPCFDVAVFEAAPGEVNDVTVDKGPSGATRVHDAGAPVRATSPQCRSVDAHTVECPPMPLTIHTGDGDDRVRGGGAAMLGPGDDHAEPTGRAEGGPGDDVLRGTPGDDLLDGGPGADVVEGGEGDDAIGLADAPGEPVADRADGGPGRDRLHFRATDWAVEVDLGRGTSGAAAAGDVLAGFEDLEGGGGRDVLVGDELANVIDGGGHHDRLAGAGGDDRLSGGEADDAIDAGDGDDTVEAGAGLDSVRGGRGADRITKSGEGGFVDAGPGDDRIEVPPLWFRSSTLRVVCGSGRDVTGSADLGWIAPDCERLRFGARGGRLALALPPRLHGRHVRMIGRGVRGARGRLVIRDRRTRRTLGSARWRGVGADRPLRVRLDRRAARRLRRRGAMPVTIEDVVTNRDGTRERSVRAGISLVRG